MKAYRVHEYGKDAKFIEDEINKPKVKKGHVVIGVKPQALILLTIRSSKEKSRLTLHYPEPFIWMWLGS